jgi:hypothetical protein
MKKVVQLVSSWYQLLHKVKKIVDFFQTLMIAVCCRYHPVFNFVQGSFLCEPGQFLSFWFVDTTRGTGRRISDIKKKVAVGTAGQTAVVLLIGTLIFAVWRDRLSFKNSSK